jgi:hypothetical protein
VRVFDVSTLATRLALSTTVFIFVIQIMTVVAVVIVLHAIHSLIAYSAIVIPSKARAAASAAPRTFVVSSQSVTTRKPPTTLVADVRSLACV